MLNVSISNSEINVVSVAKSKLYVDSLSVNDMNVELNQSPLVTFFASEVIIENSSFKNILANKIVDVISAR